jgi:hypothetical protein
MLTFKAYPQARVANDTRVLRFGHAHFPVTVLEVPQGTAVRYKTEMVKFAAHRPDETKDMINNEGMQLLAIAPRGNANLHRPVSQCQCCDAHLLISQSVLFKA